MLSRNIMAALALTAVSVIESTRAIIVTSPLTSCEAKLPLIRVSADVVARAGNGVNVVVRPGNLELAAAHARSGDVRRANVPVGQVKSLLPLMVTSRKVAMQATLALFEFVTSPALIASPITIVFVVPNCVQVTAVVGAVVSAEVRRRNATSLTVTVPSIGPGE